MKRLKVHGADMECGYSMCRNYFIDQSIAKSLLHIFLIRKPAFATGTSIFQNDLFVGVHSALFVLLFFVSNNNRFAIRPYTSAGILCRPGVKLILFRKS